MPLEQLATVTPEQAVAHPNWSMGAKISVDSAPMMNKGLEVIEAHWLFNMPLGNIEVIVHPQRIIHSVVSYQMAVTLPLKVHFIAVLARMKSLVVNWLKSTPSSV